MKAQITVLTMLLLSLLLLQGCQGGTWLPKSNTHSARPLNKREGLNPKPCSLPSRWDELHLDDPPPPGWNTHMRDVREGK